MFRSRQIFVLFILSLMVSACSMHSHIEGVNYKELSALHGDAHFIEDTKPLSKQKLLQLSIKLKKSGASCGQIPKIVNSNIVCYSLNGSNGLTRVNIWDLNLRKQTVRRYGREINEWWESKELLAAQISFAVGDGRNLI